LHAAQFGGAFNRGDAQERPRRGLDVAPGLQIREALDDLVRSRKEADARIFSPVRVRADLRGNDYPTAVEVVYAAAASSCIGSILFTSPSTLKPLVPLKPSESMMTPVTGEPGRWRSRETSEL